jgi:hypothetical protein
MKAVIKHDNINSQAAANSVVFFLFVGKSVNLHVGFLAKVRLTVLNAVC